MNSHEPLKHLRIAAACAIMFHVLGLAVAFFGIRYGTPVFSVELRMAHIATSLWGWKVAWGIWLIAAMTFVWFLATVEKVWNVTGVCARLSVVVGVAAASLDSLFDTLQIVVLPGVARGPESQPFLALAHFASAGGIVVANALYAISVALMTCALGSRLSALGRWMGWVTLIAGLLLTAVGFIDDPHLPEIFAGPAIGTYMLWVAVLAWQGPAGEWTAT